MVLGGGTAWCSPGSTPPLSILHPPLVRLPVPVRRFWLVLPWCGSLFLSAGFAWWLMDRRAPSPSSRPAARRCTSLNTALDAIGGVSTAARAVSREVPPASRHRVLTATTEQRSASLPSSQAPSPGMDSYRYITFRSN